MRIDQRNAGASVTSNGTNLYTIDRWVMLNAGASGKYTTQRNAGSVTPPVGFTNYLGITSTSAYSLGAGDIQTITQAIEGFNTADLGWGTANAQTITVSFKVYSSLTGTFGGSILNAAGNYSYPFTYSIPVANTWTNISITIVGATAGTWVGSTNGVGLYLIFSVGTGTTYKGTAGAWAASGFYGATGEVNVTGTNGATFYITGVQLEKGSTATSFDYRPYGTELALCQRYYEKSYQPTATAGTSGAGGYSSSPVGSNTVPIGQGYSQICFATVKRTNPTITFYGFQGGSGKVSNWNTGADFAASSGTLTTVGTQGFAGYNGAGATLATANFAIIYHWIAEAEL
jgi:hypothetical protein